MRIVRTGSIDDYFDRAKNIMRALDKGEEPASSQTLTFVDPDDMIEFLKLP